MAAANVAVLTLWETFAVVLAVLGVFAAICQRRCGLLLVVLLSFAFCSSATFMDARIRQGVLPIQLLFAVLGSTSLGWYLDRWRKGWLAALAAAVPLLLVLAATYYTSAALIQKVWSFLAWG